MKHDFRTRTVAPLKVVPEGDCDCIDCQKARVFADQYNKRMKPYGNTVPLDMNIHPHSFHSIDNADDPRIGKSVKSAKDEPKYHEPGEASFMTTKSGLPLGVVLGFNQKGNWMKVTATGNPGYTWVFYGDGKDFKFRDASTGSNDVWSYFGSSLGPGGAGIAAVTPVAIEKTGEAISETISSFLGPIKWILILLAIAIIVGVYFRVKG